MTATSPVQEQTTTKLRVVCQCGQAFSANAELAGKRVKCPSCDGPLEIVHTPEETPLTLEPLDDEVRTGDPFGMEDPFASQGAGTTLARRPPVREPEPKPKQGSRRRGKKQGPSSDLAAWMSANTVVIVAILGGVAVIGLLSPSIGLYFFRTTSTVTGLAGLVGGLFVWARAFEEDLICGLLFFVPLYALYYLITRWEDELPFLLAGGAIVANIVLTFYWQIVLFRLL